MRCCDVFIIEDNVQYEQQGFTNRNRIKTPHGSKWLAVPIEHVGGPLLINGVKISNQAEPDWAKRHWLSLKHNYRNCAVLGKILWIFRANLHPRLENASGSQLAFNKRHYEHFGHKHSTRYGFVSGRF